MPHPLQVCDRWSSLHGVAERHPVQAHRLHGAAAWSINPVFEACSVLTVSASGRARETAPPGGHRGYRGKSGKAGPNRDAAARDRYSRRHVRALHAGHHPEPDDGSRQRRAGAHSAPPHQHPAVLSQVSGETRGAHTHTRTHGNSAAVLLCVYVGIMRNISFSSWSRQCVFHLWSGVPPRARTEKNQEAWKLGRNLLGRMSHCHLHSD